MRRNRERLFRHVYRYLANSSPFCFSWRPLITSYLMTVSLHNFVGQKSFRLVLYCGAACWRYEFGSRHAVLLRNASLLCVLLEWRQRELVLLLHVLRHVEL